MHGMLSAAIMLIAFALVAAVAGGSTAWLYRAASGPGGRSRPPRAAPQDLPRPALALPEPAEPAGPAEPSAAEPPEGARIYVLDSSRRAGS